MNWRESYASDARRWLDRLYFGMYLTWFRRAGKDLVWHYINRSVTLKGRPLYQGNGDLPF